MGLLKKCQACVWEGEQYIDLLDVYAPWAKEFCTTVVTVSAVPVALIAQPGGSVEMAPISELHPLSTTCHFVAGVAIPACDALGGTCSFEAFHASLGVAIMPIVLDGDCAFDVMCMMLGLTSSASTRTDL